VAKLVVCELDDVPETLSGHAREYTLVAVVARTEREERPGLKIGPAHETVEIRELYFEPKERAERSKH
jgi:hypothetical protein